jgi:SpoVK/Ycf46/Vps4 family AAA+-type ATPase
VSDPTVEHTLAPVQLGSSAVGTAASVPDWYPGWAREMADLYFAANTCVFVLNGNVNDLVYCPSPNAPHPGNQFCDLTEFISQQIFGSWDIVVAYDLGRGIQVHAGTNSKRHQEMMQSLSTHLGSPSTWTRDPDQVLDQLERVIQRNLLEDDPAKRKRIAFLFPYAQYLVPAGEQSMMARGQASRLVRLLSWAQNPYIKRVNMAFCLIAETLTEVNDRLVQNPHVATIEIPLPDDRVRKIFVQANLKSPPQAVPPTNVDLSNNAAPATPSNDASNPQSLSVDAVTQLSNGLNLVNLNLALSRSSKDGKDVNSGVDTQRFRDLKKGLIERQCHGLVTFVEPSHKLDIVVGHEAAKTRLRQDARWIAEGRLDAAPMGYLICGPVGTGKTFLAECYAGSIGIPCLVLRNFRSKYVGETEGNLEKVLTVLRSLGPVVVIVDEADAALGNREMGGDSGTSGRVFSMIASQMGDTRYRGRIIWMLLTSRPELLPIDLKRQGRAEVHIPLFYPQETAELKTMFRVMAKKNKAPIDEKDVPDVSPERDLSGADIESIVLDAKRRMLTDGRNSLSADDINQSLESFIPSAQGIEKELQEMAAVLECTDRRFLPADWAKLLAEPDGRAKLQKRVSGLRELIDR